MRVVGLTGSIGCGKTAVSKMMLGADIINLDDLAHELLQKGTSATALIATRLPECVGADGSIDRTILGPKVFASPQLRRWLNGIMHWRIAVLLAKRLVWLFVTGSSLVVLDAPLLFETGLDKICFSGTLCVTTSPEVQIARLVSRDHISVEFAQQKIAAQMSSAEKAKLATHTVDNSGSLQQTSQQVDGVMAKLRGKYGISRWVLVVVLVGVVIVWKRVLG